MQLAKLSQMGPWLGFGLVAVAHFTNDAVTSMLPALLPSFAAKFGLEPSELAFFVSAFAVSTSLPQPLFGLLADRLGRQWVGAVGLAVSGVLLVGLSLASSVPWLGLALLLGGLGSSALHPAGMGLARATSATNPALAVAVFSSLGMAGGALGPVLAIGVASGWGLERLAWCALPVFFVAMLLGRQGARSAPAVVEASRGNLGRHLLNGPVRCLAASVLALEGILLVPPGSATYFTAVAGGGALLGLHGPLLISKGQELKPGSASAVAGVLLGGLPARPGSSTPGLVPRNLSSASVRR